MMNILEEAIIYSTVLHQGKARKFSGIPFILHPMEVAQILSTMTDDIEVITAGILHDVVEDTDGTLEEIKKRFGERVAFLVSSESETIYPGEDKGATWKRRKEDSLRVLKNSDDIGVKMLWLADKLANIRSLAGIYSEKGEVMWQTLNQSDPEIQRWYYQSIAENVELSLNKTGAFKELIKHINFIWPGTFDSEKARYKKYREVSIDGCQILGRGAKGDVYRYNEDLVIKIYNNNNTYRDVEREIASARRAFVLGIPTAISFGIVSVGDRYGSMYELMDAETMSQHIAKAPGQVDSYAKVMSTLAHTIHDIKATEKDDFPQVTERLISYIYGGIAHEDEAISDKCRKMIEEISGTDNLVHGDFHSGNVFMVDGEPLLIDMDRLSRGHPIAEISDLYYFYYILGEDDPTVIEKFMGFPYSTAKRFFDVFLKTYLNTEDESKIKEVTEKASIICNIRLINKLRKKGVLAGNDREIADRCIKKITELTEKYDTLTF